MRLPSIGRSDFSKNASKAGGYLRDAEKCLKKGDYANSVAACALAKIATEKAGGYSQSGRDQERYKSLNSRVNQVGIDVLALGVQRADAALRLAEDLGKGYGRVVGINRPTDSRVAQNIRHNSATDYLKTVAPLMKSVVRSAAEEAEIITRPFADFIVGEHPNNGRVKDMNNKSAESLKKLKGLRLSLEGSAS
ncbi:MAG: hypothetical protein HY516_03410 [Candidatus Aenigmarchaeota archaeon]|nr:hypothetical protein [Candidatus Aenigmarchaeota archaeon]